MSDFPELANRYRDPEPELGPTFVEHATVFGVWEANDCDGGPEPVGAPWCFTTRAAAEARVRDLEKQSRWPLFLNIEEHAVHELMPPA